LFNYKDEPPSKRLLKQHFIDANRDAFPQDTLNCVAHLILVIESPDEMMSVALEFIVKKTRSVPSRYWLCQATRQYLQACFYLLQRKLKSAELHWNSVLQPRQSVPENMASAPASCL